MTRIEAGGPGPRPASAGAPRIWLLSGFRAGDNTQLRVLAETLGWPFETKRLAYRRFELLPNLLLGATLAGLDRRRSDPLDPPYPALVISAGRRNEPVARWIRARSPGTRLVHLGRPWAPLDAFDLLVTTPQYSLPRRPNVLHNGLPLHGVTAARRRRRPSSGGRVRRAAAAWVALLVGGSAGPWTFGAAAGARLGRAASALAGGGSLLVTTSARTDPAGLAALRQAIDRPCHLHLWQKDAAENPYFGYLALADALVVTGDSISMLTESCATGRPVHIFDLGEGPLSMRAAIGAARGRDAWIGPDLRATLFLSSNRCFPERWRRDTRVLLQGTVAAGRACWLGDPAPAGAPAGPLPDLARAAAAVRALFPDAAA
ncbi:MAG: ELM1/GtrOC1 family putative glycosyltransferase [Dongiaceae bacterium]